MSVVAALALSAILAWLMLITASYVKREGWTRDGARRLSSNRDSEPAPSLIGARTDRAARNMLENLVLFTAIATAVLFSGETNGHAQFGANLFFAARLVYWPVYVFGYPWLRVVAWLAGVLGMALMTVSLL